MPIRIAVSWIKNDQLREYFWECVEHLLLTGVINKTIFSPYKTWYMG